MILMKHYAILFWISVINITVEGWLNVQPATQKSGWLDRVVAFYRKHFYKDVQTMPRIYIKASLQQAPPGYIDSKSWDADSVARLLVLLKESENGKPVLRAVRRALQPNRRFMSVQKSYKVFPSLIKDQSNVFYYDIDSQEYYDDEKNNSYIGIPDDNDVLFITNPVEARLPSAGISIGLLRTILDARAAAARIMSTTTQSKMTWKSKNFSSANTTKDDGMHSSTITNTNVSGPPGNSTVSTTPTPDNSTVSSNTNSTHSNTNSTTADITTIAA